jgi:hypothetical protein
MACLLNKSPTLFERLADEKKRIELAASLLEPGLKRNKLCKSLVSLMSPPR